MMQLLMLSHITIQNFTIIESLDLDLIKGMTAITGETGAGKSIMIDALELALGNRADVSVIRQGCDRCEIFVTFDVQHIPEATQWLKEHDLESDGECILRRTIATDGRSRSFINGNPVPLQLLKELSGFLVNIHGQHEHQSLLKREEQRKLLDSYAGHPLLVSEVAITYKQWRNAQDELTSLQILANNRSARFDLLSYQVQELDALALDENEFAELDSEQKQLANADHLLENCQLALHYLADQEEQNTLSLLQRACNNLNEFNHVNERLKTCTELLTNAIVEVEEATTELRHYLDHIELNPERLQTVEERLASIFEMARKHHVTPQQLPSVHQQLSKELQQLEHSDERIKELQSTIEKLHHDYLESANKLSKSRQTAAKKLAKLVSQSMQMLGMPDGQFSIKFDANDQFSPYGLDRIEFMVSANPGQPLQSLNKVASGGELSRISLAIQVITAQTEDTPTLIFDEVDVGIGGGIATIVGKLLRTLGTNAQVLCVTHLPQVAAHAHQHLQVDKQTHTGNTHTTIRALDHQDKIQEIARMLGGIKITEQTLAHAKEMLEMV